MVNELETADELVVKQVLDVWQLQDHLQEFVLFDFKRQNDLDINHELIVHLVISCLSKDDRFLAQEELNEAVRPRRE